MSDPRPGPGACSHDKIALASGSWPSGTISNFPLHSLHAQLRDTVLAQLSNNKLNRNKLPSTTQFGLIQFIAEADQLLELFSSLLIKNVSSLWNAYGAYTWGWVPLYNDIQGILKAILNLNHAMKDITSYEDSWNINIPEGVVGYGQQLSGCWLYVKRYGATVVCRNTGTLETSGDFSGKALKLLDFIGLHPDLATVWDLLPFSFVVDYVLPVGSLLSEFQGWVKAGYYQGYTTAKCEYTASFSLDKENRPGPYRMIDPKEATGKIFFRRFRGDVLEDSPNLTLPKLRRPNIKQSINTLYLLLSSVAGGRLAKR